jgi:hypothetical protein
VYRKHEAELKEAQQEVKKHNFARYQAASKKFQAEERQAMAEAAPGILSAGALKRVRQIQRQARGLHNLIQEAAVRKKLNIDDEQAKQIEESLKEGREEARKEAAKRQTGDILAPMTIEDFIVSEQKSYTASMKRAVGVLTDDQRRIWTDLVGEPFAFKAAAAK